MAKALNKELEKLKTSNIDGGERGADGGEVETYDFVRSPHHLSSCFTNWSTRSVSGTTVLVHSSDKQEFNVPISF